MGGIFQPFPALRGFAASRLLATGSLERLQPAARRVADGIVRSGRPQGDVRTEALPTNRGFVKEYCGLTIHNMDSNI